MLKGAMFMCACVGLRGTMATITAVPQAADQQLRLWQKRAGFLGRFAAVNHKDIGRRYIATGLIYFLLASTTALLMRIQLAFLCPM